MDRPPLGPQRRGRSAVLVLAALGAPALWHCCVSSGYGFVLGRSTAHLPGVVRGCRQGQSTLRRAGGYAFELAQSDEHTNLMVEETDPGTVKVFTAGSFVKGDYNTVLGDKELPASGRSYWEVKIVKKPSDAWEYIGVAEPTADLTVPLPRNKKGAGWFWGSTWTDSFIYTYLPMRPEWNKQEIERHKDFVKDIEELFPPKSKAIGEGALALSQYDKSFTGPGTHVGMIQDSHPPFENGMVIGVDVDMDDGSLAFWADGKYLGKVRDTEGKPVNLKGKKVVPAFTIYGRKTGAGNQFTVMEVTTGLEPPAKP